MEGCHFVALKTSGNPDMKTGPSDSPSLSVVIDMGPHPSDSDCPHYTKSVNTPWWAMVT
jgi:hypothetical protein